MDKVLLKQTVIDQRETFTKEEKAIPRFGGGF